VKRSEKNSTVEALHEDFKSLTTTVLLDYKGLNVEKISELRNRLREEKVELKVVKNTLSKIAAQKTDLEKLETYFIGPTAITISKDDPVAGIKTLADFIKENPKLEYKAALVEGSFIDKSQIPALAELPSREVLLGRFLGTLQAPVSAFVRVLAGNITGLLNVLNGIKDSKGE
jgi:large subunit ribosomal protein L10